MRNHLMRQTSIDPVSVYCQCGTSCSCRVGFGPWEPGVSYSYYLSTTGKVCVMMCMIIGKIRKIWGPSMQLDAVCEDA